MGSSTYCHMCDEYYEDCACARRLSEEGYETGYAEGLEDGVRLILSRVASEAACGDCGETVWFIVPASRLPRTPGNFKTRPLHLNWQVFDVSGKRHNCPQRKQRMGVTGATP